MVVVASILQEAGLVSMLMNLLVDVERNGK